MIEERTQALDPSIFRAYDIRGITGVTLTEGAVYLIGKAIASVVRENGEHQIAMARDGRKSGPAFAKALSEGIISVGCDVIDLGMIPTPLLYYATHVFDEHSGVMITGSHNPSEYNGLKIVINHLPYAGDKLKSLYDRIIEKRFHEGYGFRHELNIVERYIHHVSRDIRIARPLKIVIDAGHGVTGQMAPLLFEALGCEVHQLFCDIDGSFPHHHPDPSQPENLQDLIREVQEKKADIGLAFDGDGDRLGVVTNRGEIICPDRLLILFAKTVLAKHPGSKVIYDVKCTHYLQSAITSFGGEPLMWKTGHSYIKTKMAALSALLAGEMSGHFFFKDRWYGFDDALYAGARLLEILSQESMDSDALFKTIPNSINTPELKVKVKEEEKFPLMQKLIEQAHFSDAKEVMTIDGIRVNFADGWGLVRPSNTTPYLILRFEAGNDVMLKQIQSLFRAWILSVKPDLILPF